MADIKRKVIVDEWLMNRITAMCDVASDNEEKALSNVAKAIREEINKGLDYVKEDDSLIDLNDAVYKNKEKAIEVLKTKPNGEVVFNDCEEIENLEINGDEPYVVEDDGDGFGTLRDIMVLRAKYSEKYGIELLVWRNYGFEGLDWIPISDALCHTENNVYERIIKG